MIYTMGNWFHTSSSRFRRKENRPIETPCDCVICPGGICTWGNPITFAHDPAPLGPANEYTTRCGPGGDDARAYRDYSAVYPAGDADALADSPTAANP